MYELDDKTGQYGSHDQADAAPARSTNLSPELREVLHMLDAIEQNATARNPSR